MVCFFWFCCADVRLILVTSLHSKALRCVATNLHIHTIIIKAPAAPAPLPPSGALPPSTPGGGGGGGGGAETSVGNLVDLTAGDCTDDTAASPGSTSTANPLHTAAVAAAGDGTAQAPEGRATGLARIPPGEVKGFSTITCGAPVAHVLGMPAGGMAAMEEKLEALLNTLRDGEMRAAEQEGRDVVFSSLTTTAAPGGIMHLSAGACIKSVYASGRWVKTKPRNHMLTAPHWNRGVQKERERETAACLSRSIACVPGSGSIPH